MHPFLIKRYAEKTMLWAALGTLNAPLAFVPALLAGVIQHRQSRDTPEESLRAIIHAGRYRLLDSASPTAMTAHQMGEKIGVTFTHLYLSPEPDFENIMILQERPSEAALLFQGDPLQDVDLVRAGQEQAFLRGIIAHELGHTHTRGTNHFNHNATITARLYGVASCAAMSVGWACALMGSFATGLGFIGMAAGAAAAGTAAFVLRSQHSKNDEFLADIHGAKIFGADDMIITHDFAAKIIEPQIEKWKAANINRLPPTRLGDLYEKFIAATHPSSADRIDALRSIFKSNATFNMADGPASKTRYAPFVSERLQATRIEPKNPQ